MRLAILLVITLSAASGCAKKSAAPKSPASATQAAPDSGSATPTETAAPAPAADPGGVSGGGQPTTKSDPEEGGQ
jgi:hypothetical protein